MFHSMSTSRKCHDGPCGPCFLCKSASKQFTHPVRFNSEQYTFLCKFEEQCIDKTVCICYPCSKDIKRNINNMLFKPRWRKAEKKCNGRCAIQSCENTAIKNTHLASNEDVEKILERPVISFTVVDEVVSVRLCQKHYNEVYCRLNLSSPCESCGSKPRKGEQFNRRCPRPESINTYLTIVSSEPSHLTEESIICPACYKHFVVIKQNILEGKVTTPKTQNMTTAQRNGDIDRILCMLTSKQASIYEKRETATMSDYFEFVVCLICKTFGEQMKADEAILLPKMHKDFVQEIYANIGPFSNSVHVHVHVCQSGIPTTRWLLSRLHLYFDNMLEVQCRHRRYGTLVYHNSCDLVQALSSALGKSDTKTKPTNNEPNTEDQAQQHSTPPPVEQVHVQSVTSYMNTKLHERARVIKSSFDATPESVSSLNLAAALDNVDPELLNFLLTMTQPVRQSRRNLFENNTTQTDMNTTKNIRLFMHFPC